MRRIFLSALLGSLTALPAGAQYPYPPRVERVAEPAPPPKAEPVEEPAVPRAEPVGDVDDGTPRRAEVVPEDADDSTPAAPPASEKSGGKNHGKDGKKSDGKRDDEAEPIDVKAVPSDEAEPLDVKPAGPGAIPKDPEKDKKPEKPKIAIKLNTDTNARPLTLRVPAPRGQIVDRHGEPLAQNRVGYYLGVQLPMADNLPDSAVINTARFGVDWVGKNLPGGWEMPNEKVLEHYRKRRWVPLLSDTLVPDDMVAKLKEHLPATVVLRPFYLRSYPNEAMAAHLLGYMQKNGAQASGEMTTEEMLWTPTIGATGLEKRFDADLTGKAGLYSVLYNAAGEKVTEEWVERPTAGNTVVTSIDARFQRIVEHEMKADKVKGAFVIMDVKTGDVIAVCSNPGYNPNDWVYGISKDKYREMATDPETPLYARAWQGLYPPASTFKVVTAFAALESGKITDDTEFDCPNAMMFGNLRMRNHNKRGEGPMNVIRAIKRSCNTWFFQAARVAGADAVSSMGLRLGFGEKTGIALPDNVESKGYMPTPESTQRRGGRLVGAALANISIGQGTVLATPLQVAQMMAGVARGDAIPRPRLVRQIQDVKGSIVQSFPPSIRATLTLKKDSIEAVRKGMRAVVADGDGTGKEASNNYVAISGKTGTGEWKASPKRNVAWFAGFIPSKNPEYAFAAIYEGAIEETVSGGKTVAPLVGNVFNKIYKLKKEGNEMPEDKASGKDKKGKDKDGDETDDDADQDQDRPLASNTRRRKPAAAAEPAAAPAPAPAPVPVVAQPPVRGLKAFFNRLRRGR